MYLHISLHLTYVKYRQKLLYNTNHLENMFSGFADCPKLRINDFNFLNFGNTDASAKECRWNKQAKSSMMLETATIALKCWLNQQEYLPALLKISSWLLISVNIWCAFPDDPGCVWRSVLQSSWLSLLSLTCFLSKPLPPCQEKYCWLLYLQQFSLSRCVTDGWFLCWKAGPSASAAWPRAGCMCWSGCRPGETQRAAENRRAS